MSEETPEAPKPKPKRRVGMVGCHVMRERTGTVVVCGRCQNTQSVPRTDEGAEGACFKLLRETCPEQVSAFYVHDAMKPRKYVPPGTYIWMDEHGNVVPAAPKPSLPQRKGRPGR